MKPGKNSKTFFWLPERKRLVKYILVQDILQWRRILFLCFSLSLKVLKLLINGSRYQMGLGLQHVCQKLANWRFKLNRSSRNHVISWFPQCPYSKDSHSGLIQPCPKPRYAKWQTALKVSDFKKPIELATSKSIKLKDSMKTTYLYQRHLEKCIPNFSVKK